MCFPMSCPASLLALLCPRVVGRGFVIELSVVADFLEFCDYHAYGKDHTDARVVVFAVIVLSGNAVCSLSFVPRLAKTLLWGCSRSGSFS